MTSISYGVCFRLNGRLPTNCRLRCRSVNTNSLFNQKYFDFSNCLLVLDLLASNAAFALYCNLSDAKLRFASVLRYRLARVVKSEYRLFWVNNLFNRIT